MKYFPLFICLLLTSCSHSPSQNTPQQVAMLMGEQPLCKKVMAKSASDVEMKAYADRSINCSQYEKKAPVQKPKKIVKETTIATKSPSNLPESDIKSKALSVCRNSVIASLHFPSSFDQEVLSTSVSMIQNRSAAVEMPFNAKNGFGVDIPQVARCFVNSYGELFFIDVSNR